MELTSSILLKYFFSFTVKNAWKYKSTKRALLGGTQIQ